MNEPPVIPQVVPVVKVQSGFGTVFKIVLYVLISIPVALVLIFIAFFFFGATLTGVVASIAKAHSPPTAQASPQGPAVAESDKSNTESLASAPKKTKADLWKDAVNVTLVSKREVEGIGRQTAIVYRLVNQSTSVISVLKFNARFNDLLGEKLETLKAVCDETIQPGATNDLSLVYSFVDSRFRSIESKKMEMVVEPEALVFESGEKIEVDKN